MHAVPGALSLSFILLVAVLYSTMVLGVTYAVGRGTDERRLPVFGLRLILGGWILLTGLLAVRGVFLDFATFPPLIMVTALVGGLSFAAFAFSKSVGRWLREIPQSWLIGLQVFRVAVELQLFFLAKTDYLPRAMTFEGRNFDIVVGVTAPLVAAFVAKAREKNVANLIIGWNIVGMLILANTVATAVLSAPTNFRVIMEQPANTAIGYFPFAWLPAFVVPFAYFLHFVSLRKAVAQSRKRSARG